MVNFCLESVGAPPVCDDFQIAVLMTPIEYKKHKELRSASSKMPFDIRLYFLNSMSLSGLLHAVHSCDCHRKLTVTAQGRTTCPRRCGTLVVLSVVK